MSNLKTETVQRVVSAFIVAPFVVLCFVSYNSLVGLVAAIVMISSGEFFYTTLRKHGAWLMVVYTGIVSAFPILYGTFFQERPMELLAYVYMAGIVFTLAQVKNREIVTEIYFAFTTALVYIAFLLSFFIPLYAKFGADAALLTLTLSWSYDSFAFAFGMSTGGKHKLGSYYSPNKSWEGLFGGIFGTTLYIVLYQNVARLFFNSDLNLPFPTVLMIATITAIFDTFGDIFESSIKRHYNVKHMGNLLPGHGGMLDRIDGLLFITPAVYTIFTMAR